MYVMQISRHSPESCPTVNESTVKVTVDLIKNLDSLAAKHGMKLVGSWTDHPMHMIYIFTKHLIWRPFSVIVKSRNV